MKASFDLCKKKLSEVLAALKTQLEGRYKQKLDSVMSTMNSAGDDVVVQQTPRMMTDERNNEVRVSNTNLVSQSVDAPTKLLPLGPVTLNKNDASMVSHRSPSNFNH